MTTKPFYLVRKRTPIPNGITCSRCNHERPPRLKSCPKCEDTALRDLDTSTKALLARGATTRRIAILTWIVMQLKGGLV